MHRAALTVVLGSVACLFPGEARGQTHLFTFEADYAGQWYGTQVRGAGDVNRDGHADLIVAMEFDGKKQKKGDVGRVFSGRDGRLLHAIQGDYNARDVTGVGDLNRDGHHDFALLLPGPLADDVLVVSGKDGSSLYRVQGIAASATSIASAGDVNRDGTPDVLVGDPSFGTFFHPGRAVVLSGKDGSVLHDLRAWNINHVDFGWAVSGAGDVDRDGHADFLVGDSNYGGANPRLPVGAGRVWLYSGKTAKVLYTWTGAARGDVFGGSLAAAGDVDRDGVPDVIVGSSGNSKNGISSGVAHVYSGKTGLVIRTFRGKAAGANLGHSVSGIDDWNRDGTPDLAIGALTESSNGTRSGSVYVYSGKDGRELHRIVGRAAKLGFGAWVACAGDVDADGLRDLVVGTFQVLGPGPRFAHYFQVWSGAPLALSTDTHLVSLSKNGSQSFRLAAGSSRAYGLYLVLGSMSGIRPGVRLGTVRIPLNHDLYSGMTLILANSLLLPASLGLLDNAGRGQARFTAIPQVPASLVGARLDHAFVLLGTRGIPFASNPVPLLLQK